ncbi:hypothetical protein Clacol_008895 [Clathrus columnatus]|uniref:Hydrophobin n=1 Tax=Clathrus columnatus TaxID=1419009 RepID=A0AAV5ANA8_9AGAM|nr:hypothetical protein Clacol_008895 [Clathrus columnatus]
MFAKLVVLVATFGGLVSAWTTVTASPPAPTVTSISQCNTGAASCCNTFGSASTLPGVSTALSLVQVVLDDPNINVGLACAALYVNIYCETCRVYLTTFPPLAMSVAVAPKPRFAALTMISAAS